MNWRHPMAALAVLLVAGCSQPIAGTPTWPGARLEKALLTAADFPRGVQYNRIEHPIRESGGRAGPPAMLSRPEGCSEALTRAIEEADVRGPGSAAEYLVGYNGARMDMTVLTWNLDLDKLSAAADRCAQFEAFFDPHAPGIPMTTARVQTPRADALVYQQTIKLGTATSSVYFSFENVGAMAVFGIAFPTPNPTIPVKGSLPQTFLDVAAKQAQRAGSR